MLKVYGWTQDVIDGPYGRMLVIIYLVTRVTKSFEK